MGKCQVFFCPLVNNIHMNKQLRREIIQKRLKEELENCGLKYIDIAKAVGINVALLSQYKSGKKLPSIENFSTICEVIGADANYILGIIDDG